MSMPRLPSYNDCRSCLASQLPDALGQAGVGGDLVDDPVPGSVRSSSWACACNHQALRIPDEPAVCGRMEYKAELAGCAWAV